VADAKALSLKVTAIAIFGDGRYANAPASPENNGFCMSQLPVVTMPSP
jgi:hypothetical protein